jgi:peptidoglycan-associated lipoprotein
MMKRSLVVIGVLVLVLGLSVVLFTGCAKRDIVKEEVAKEEKVVAPEEKPAAVQPTEAELQKQKMEAALREKRLEEKQASEFKDIYYDFDKFNLKPEARELLRRHADWLLEHSNFDVIIEGHCDERGTNEYNLALGERRAASAMKYLADLGVEKKRLTTISYGEELPLDPGHNEEAWAKNRRAHFVVTPRK